jgi:hypothetical protein
MSAPSSKTTTPRSPRRAQAGRRLGLFAACTAVVVVFLLSLSYRRGDPGATRRAVNATELPARSPVLEASVSSDAIPRAEARPRASGVSERTQIPRLVAALGEGASVSGRVVDASGGSVAGALVTTVAPTGGQALPNGVAETDGEGRFRLETSSGWVRLTARADGYSSASLRLFAPAHDATLVMVAASALSGRVLRADSEEPVAGVRVVIESSNGLLVQPLFVSSAADGSFRVDQLPAGRYGLYAAGGGWRSEPLWVSVAVAQSEEVELRALPAAELVGIISRGGQACPNGSILWLGPAPLFTVDDMSAADDQGRVRIEGLPPGSYDLTVNCPPALQRETLELGKEPVVREWDFEPGLVLEGSVRRANGQPLPGAIVIVEPAQPEGASPLGSGAAAVQRQGSECRADAAGEFRCEGLAPGEYDCAVARSGAVGSGQRVLLQGTSKTRVMLMADAEAAIVVHAPGGAAFPSGSTVLARGDTLPAPITGERTATGFRFDHLPLGQYGVYLAGASAREVALERDAEEVELELAVPSAEPITGSVVDEQGVPVLDAWVRARAPAGVDGDSVLTDASGAFETTPLLRGRYDLNVTSPRGEVTVPGIQTGTTDLLVRLPSYGALSGVIESESGTSSAWFSLTLAHEDGSERSLSGDHTWSVPWAAPGRYRLTATSNLGSAALEVVLEPGAERHVTVRVPTAGAVGPVRDLRADGRPAR